MVWVAGASVAAVLARGGQWSEALAAFYTATEEMGIADRVTSFTLSDFGRTLTSNGDGSDHGWGAHHFVLGGAVRGGTIYGSFPAIALGTAADSTGAVISSAIAESAFSIAATMAV